MGQTYMEQVLLPESITILIMEWLDAIQIGSATEGKKTKDVAGETASFNLESFISMG